MSLVFWIEDARWASKRQAMFCSQECNRVKGVGLSCFKKVFYVPPLPFFFIFLCELVVAARRT